MTRTLVFIAALAVAALAIWLAGNHLFVATRVEPAPKVDEVNRQFPNHDENESASRFLATMTRFDEAQLSQIREAEIEYLRHEVSSPAAESSPPPEKLEKFLASNESAIHLMRAQLASNPPPQWKQRADDLLETPQPDLILLNRVFLLLSANALREHSKHADAAAWSDLGAMWVLTRSLWARPEASSVMTALTGSRLIGAVASRLPPPAPAWWTEFASCDLRTPLARALEYEAWATRTRADRYPMGEPDDNAVHDTLRRTLEPFARGVSVLQADARVRDLRELMQSVKTMDPCGELPHAARARWTGSLNRFNRFLVERDGVGKLIAIQETRSKTGAWPATIDDHSVCDGKRWVYSATAGGMQLRFGGHVVVPEARIITPLEYKR